MHKITIDETEEDVMVAVLHKRTKEMVDALKQYEEQLKLKCW